MFCLTTLTACSTEVPGADRDQRLSASQGPRAEINPPTLFEALPPTESSRIQSEPTLLRRLQNSPTILNPLFNSLWEDHFMHALLYVYPVTRDINMQQMFDPAVVQSWQRSEDGKTFTLQLNPELRWHDGKPWTAHDIVFTYRTILDDRVPALFYKLFASRLDTVRAIDDHTVEYVHKEVLATYMRDMALPVIPKHIFDNSEERAKDPTLRSSEYFSRHGHREVIGSGSYRLVDWRANDQIIVERWEESPLPPAPFARQILKIVPDVNVALLLFKKGELHETSLQSQQFATQTDDAEFRSVGVKATGPWRMTASLAWRMDGSNPFFEDARVRRAMSHAFDYERFLRDALYGVYQPSSGIFDQQHWAYNPNIDRLSYDLETAKQLLDEAGWLVDGDTGWRYKLIDGQRVPFEFELLVGQGNPTWAKLVNLYSQGLRRVGIKLNPRLMEVAALVARLKKKDFQAYIAVIEVTNDPDEWSNFWASEAIRDGYNYVGYSNPEVDALFEAGRRELDQDRRIPIYQEI
ncbi:MAG: ABC transporter substrate-binding protein, partial [Planctomycetota bacterium]